MSSLVEKLVLLRANLTVFVLTVFAEYFYNDVDCIEDISLGPD